MLALAAALVLVLLGECGLASSHDELHEGVQQHQKLVPAIFAFGDSLLDAGNNNRLRTLAKADFLPYGQDFPTHTPTGRFANGYIVLDLLAIKLGLPLIPLHSEPSTNGVKLLQGVNFASAGSGILPYTGLDFGKVLPLDTQIRQFAEVKEEVITMIGANATDSFLSTALFYIVSGSNDWLTTYFFSGTPLARVYTKPQYRDLMIAKFISQIKELYCLGARRMAVVGLSAFGCCPSQLRTYKAVNGTCVGWLNDLAKDFNNHLRTQLLELPKTLPGSELAFQDSYAALLEVHDNPSSYGYTTVDHACCGIGKYGGFINCYKGFPVCGDVKQHLFWDSYHPTSKFYEQFIELVWNNGPPYSYPYSGKEFLSR